VAIVERAHKDGSKTFWCVVRQNGKQVWINGGHQRRAAQELHDELATKGRHNALPTARDIKFGILTERYFSNGCHDLRSQTISAYRSRTKNHLLPFFGDVRVRQGVSTEAVGRWIAWQRHKGVSDKTVRSSLVTLSAIMSYAVSINLVMDNPCHKVRPPKVKNEGVDHTLTPEQTKTLIRNTPNKGSDRALMSFLVMTGCRPSEAAELRWRDIVWQEHMVIISRTATRQGSNEPKNGKSRRIPLAASLVRAMGEQKQAANGGLDDLCFPAVRGGRRDMGRFARDALRPALTRAGLSVPDGSDSLYILRKSLASNLLQQGESVKLIGDMLGQSPEVLLKHYTKVRQEDATAAISRIAAMMVGDGDIKGAIAQTA